jgi:hypothetical protein
MFIPYIYYLNKGLKSKIDRGKVFLTNKNSLYKNQKKSLIILSFFNLKG